MLDAAGISKGSVIKAIGSTETPTLEAFEKAILSFADGERTTVRYFNETDKHRDQVTVITIDRHWAPASLWTRDDKTGKWLRRLFPVPPPPKPPVPGHTTPLRVTSILPAPVSEVVSSMVLVSFKAPYMVEGLTTSYCTGTGLIVSAEHGLVIVDRNTVPSALGDCNIVFGSSLRLSGTVRFLHPVHNFAIISYDPKLLLDSPFRTLKTDTSDRQLIQGEEVYLLTLSVNGKVLGQKTNVSKVMECFVAESSLPRFRATHEEVIYLDQVLNSGIGGAIVEEGGSVLAFWFTYSSVNKENKDITFLRGMPVSLALPAINALIYNTQPDYRCLGIEVWPSPLSNARDIG